MSLSSLFRKNKQEPASEDGEFSAPTDEESSAVRSRGKRKQRAQANEPVDPALPEKKRARRRLVGAVALVLAAVIVLPMVLDSEPKPLAEDIAIQIPSKDTPRARAATAPSTAQQPAESKMAIAAGLDKDEEIIQPPPAIAAPVKTEQSVVKPALEKSVMPPPSASAAEDKSEAAVKPASKVDDKMQTQSVPAKKPDDLERARAILEGRTIAKADNATAQSDSKSGTYLVQVAALASQDKVHELQNKLKSAGIKSHTQKVATARGERIRIRVGPFPSREEADKMREKLAKLGLNGTLVPA